MILADPLGRSAAARISGRATIDELLSWAATRRPDALALLDAPDRESITDGKPARNQFGMAARDRDETIG